MSDSFDLLSRACARSQEWPSNLIRSPNSKRLLDQYRDRLEQEKQSLFAKPTDGSRVDVWEGWAGNHCLRNSQWSDIEEVQAHIDNHLLRKQKDPQFRHLFLPASGSSVPLNCSFEMFCYISSFHQISPEFVDLVHTFGLHDNASRDSRRRRIFQQIDISDSHRLGITALGRSGDETRVGYNLSAMELSNGSKNWKLRGTVIYHSLDLVTGRSFWLTTMANGILAERVMSTFCDARGGAHCVPYTPQTALVQTLQIHSILLEYTWENWSSYIDCLELESRIKSASPDTMMQQLQESNEPGLDCEEQFEHTIQRLSILRSNSCKELQQLNLMSSKMKQAQCAMAGNITIMKELREYHTSLLEAPHLLEAIRIDCTADMHEFIERIIALERSFESGCLRCDTLMIQLEDAKAVYALILEEQSKEIERQFAWNSKDSTERMEKETSSMHMITFLTLIFLPGTFIAAVFSTPIFGDGSSAKFDERMFLTFLEICIPLTVVTLIAWMVYMRYKKMGRNRAGAQRAKPTSEV